MAWMPKIAFKAKLVELLDVLPSSIDSLAWCVSLLSTSVDECHGLSTRKLSVGHEILRPTMKCVVLFDDYTSAMERLVLCGTY